MAKFFFVCLGWLSSIFLFSALSYYYSLKLWDKGNGNIPAAYMVGLILADKAKRKDIKGVVLDIGLQKSVKGSRIYAVLRGCVDGGLDVAHSDAILPSEERINGKHIKDFDGNKFEEIKKKIGAKNAWW